MVTAILGLVMATGIAFLPHAAEDAIGAASKEGESLGGLHRSDQPGSGAGEFETADVDAPGREAEQTISVAVVTEKEIAVDTDAFADIVFDILNDDRGWGGDGSVGFAAAESDAELTIRLATPGTVDDLCAPLETNGYTSCRVEDEIILNVDRWAGATDEFLDEGGTLDDYRAYLVNHETGHVLGHGHVDECGEDGRAPVMMQQTLDLRGCEPNGWPTIP